jgi:hypothetical protein
MDPAASAPTPRAIAEVATVVALPTDTGTPVFASAPGVVVLVTVFAAVVVFAGVVVLVVVLGFDVVVLEDGAAEGVVEVVVGGQVVFEPLPPLPPPLPPFPPVPPLPPLPLWPGWLGDGLGEVGVVDAVVGVV